MDHARCEPRAGGAGRRAGPRGGARAAPTRRARRRTPPTRRRRRPPGGNGKARRPASPVIAVLVEPGRPQVAAELLGAAARLGHEVGAVVHALVPIDTAGPCRPLPALTWWWRWWAPGPPRTSADAVAAYVREACPWAVLAPSTAFGREVAGRAAAATGSGLVGDAIALSARAGVLVAAKPAFAGALVADITCRSATQMVTVRPGVLPAPARPRRTGPGPPSTERAVGTRGRVRVLVRPPQRRRRDAGPGRRRHRGGCRSRARGVRAAEPPGRAAGRRARRHAQGDRPGLGPEVPPGRPHGQVHRAPPLHRVGTQREVQPHGRRARRRDDPGREHRPPAPRSSRTATSASSATGTRSCRSSTKPCAPAQQAPAPCALPGPRPADDAEIRRRCRGVSGQQLAERAQPRAGGRSSSPGRPRTRAS